MKSIIFLTILFLAIPGFSQTARIPEPQYVAVDSKDNVYVAIKYGIVRITPDGVRQRGSGRD